MSITYILQLALRQRQSNVPLAALPLPVLGLQAHIENCAHQSTQPHKRKRRAVACFIAWSLLLQIDIGADYTTNVAYADLHGGSEGAFVVPAHIIGEPDYAHGLCDVDARGDEENCHIPDAEWQPADSGRWALS